GPEPHIRHPACGIGLGAMQQDDRRAILRPTCDHECRALAGRQGQMLRLHGPAFQHLPILPLDGGGRLGAAKDRAAAHRRSARRAWNSSSTRATSAGSPITMTFRLPAIVSNAVLTFSGGEVESRGMVA